MTPAEHLMNTVEWQQSEIDVEDDGSGLPYATHEGVLTIAGFAFKCYQLSDGRRVFDAESVKRFFLGEHADTAKRNQACRCGEYETCDVCIEEHRRFQNETK